MSCIDSFYRSDPEPVVLKILDGIYTTHTLCMHQCKASLEANFLLLVQVCLVAYDCYSSIVKSTVNGLNRTNFPQDFSLNMYTQ